ncbi:hypothetical protein DFH28DRAFT_238643 [Melampsora americana]|nr:hypothetical protein DFH28DRAFT_238643 [Melampsora americana]
MNFPSWLKSLGGFSTPSRFEQQPDSKNHQQNVSSGSTLSKTSHTGSKNSSDDKRSGKLKRDQPSRPLTYPRDTNLKNETQTKNLKRTRSPSGLSNERNSKQKLTCLEEQNQSSKPWLHQLFKAVGINSIQTSQTNISPSLEPILPNGWIKEIDRLGREFYVNQVTHQTSFEFPRIEDIDRR